MDVGSTTPQRVDHQYVDEAHDRSVFAHPGKAGKIYFVILLKDLDLACKRFVVEVKTIERDKIGVRETVAVSSFNRAIRTHSSQFDLPGTAVVFGDRRLNACFGHDHRLDIKSSHELDVVHREDIRRIDHSERESGADP